MMLMILGFHRFGCPVAQGLVQALRVPPRDPPERRQFWLGQVGEWLAPPHQLGLVRAVDAFGHGVVVRVADRAGRGKHAVFPDLGGVHRPDVCFCQIEVVQNGVSIQSRALRPVGAGKTQLAVALGRLACMRAIPVGFFTATGLLMRLRRAKRGGAARRGAPADRQGEAPGHRRVRLHADRPHRAPRKAHRIRGRLLP